MGLVGIKTSEGGYVGFDRDGRAQGRPTPYLFDMRPCAGGFTFRALGGEARLGLSARWDPLETEERRLKRQTYELIPVGDMGEADHARITAHWEKKIRART